MDERTRARAASGAGLTGRTRSERILWEQLRGREPGWLAEVPTGQYRLDFFCPDLRLAVEVDGTSHRGERARKYDERRDHWHLQHGIRTVRVSAREVEQDLAFVLQHIDAAVGRRRLEFAIMPPSSQPIWHAPQPPPPARPQEPRRRLRVPARRPPAVRSSSKRRRRARTEPSWLAIAVMTLAVLAFFGNWFGAQDAYWKVTSQGADRVAKSLTENLGGDMAIPRPVTAATVCTEGTPSCGPSLAADQAQLLADRINMSVPAAELPADLICEGVPSSVVTVTFESGARRTAVQVLPGCRVVVTPQGVRRATPGVLSQVAAALPTPGSP